MEFFKTKIRPWIGIIALLVIGIMMIAQPDAAAGAEVSGRQTLLKSVVKMVWGMPAGVICVLLAVGLGYLQVKGGGDEEVVEEK